MKRNSPKNSLVALVVTVVVAGSFILLYELMQNALAARIGYGLSCVVSMAASVAVAAAISWSVLREKYSKNDAIQKLHKLSVEHERMGEQLYEALDLNAKIISDAPTGIAVFKASGECIVGNEAMARIVGTTLPKYLAHNFRELETWRASGMLKAAGETLATGEPRQTEFHGVTAMGKKEIWIVCQFSCITWGHEPHLLLLVNDVTEQKRAEVKIREQASLLDHARDAIFVLDMDWRISYWNQGAQRLFGWTAEEAVGKNPVDLMFRGIMTQQLRTAIDQTMSRGEWQGELNEVSKDGKTVVVQGRSTLIYDEQGRPKGVLVIDTEITEKKRLEEQFLRAQRMESLGTLASGIAHDLNNVLTPLMIAVQVLRQKRSDPDDHMLLEALECNVNRGANLIKQVLTFGRGITGERVRVQLIRLVREIEQIVQRTFPRSIEFEFDAPDELFAVIGDPTQLHQVLLNLSVNALDAMPDGGKLSIRLENIVIDDLFAAVNGDFRTGSYVLITVSDTGAGMTKEVHDRIFEPFFTTKPTGKGTGLGLSTSLGIVKSHGGFIHCDSAPGKGSAFKVYVPASPKPAAAGMTGQVAVDLPRGRGEWVLVVDDEEPIRLAARAALEQFGYRVLLAADGLEGVSVYGGRHSEIAAVIVDVIMPVMDGPSAVAEFKSINPDVIIIGSSGLELSNADLGRLSRAGVKHFIRKPYTAETMLKTLDKALGPKRVAHAPLAPETSASVVQAR